MKSITQVCNEALQVNENLDQAYEAQLAKLLKSFDKLCINGKVTLRSAGMTDDSKGKNITVILWMDDNKLDTSKLISIVKKFADSKNLQLSTAYVDGVRKVDNDRQDWNNALARKAKFSYGLVLFANNFGSYTTSHYKQL